MSESPVWFASRRPMSFGLMLPVREFTMGGDTPRWADMLALARQVAMYIAHVSYGLSLTEVGSAFERDRTTVAHACSVVEVKREDPQFDEAITLVERIIRAMCGATGAIEKGASAKASANSRDR